MLRQLWTIYLVLGFGNRAAGSGESGGFTIREEMRLDAHNSRVLHGLVHYGGNLSDEPLQRFAHESPS